MATASLVPARLVEPQTLRGAGRPAGGLERMSVVLVACALVGVGAGLLFVRPSPPSRVIAQEGHARPTAAKVVDGSPVPFQGVGAWADVWDYAPSYQDPGEAPVVGPADVATMAAGGARTLYLQTAGLARTAGHLEDPELLGRFLAAAHARGVRVVGWYAPPLDDPEEDLARLLAVARFSTRGERFDGMAVDVGVNHGTRDARRQLLALSGRLRATVGAHFPLAVVVPPGALEAAGSAFPWRSLHRLYDAWIPRVAWTPGTTEGADPATVTRSTVDRLRGLVGDPKAAVHVLGEKGGALSEAEARAFAGAAAEARAQGASVYDFRTTPVGTLIEIGRASAGGFGDSELFE